MSDYESLCNEIRLLPFQTSNDEIGRELTSNNQEKSNFLKFQNTFILLQQAPPLKTRSS